MVIYIIMWKIIHKFPCLFCGKCELYTKLSTLSTKFVDTYERGLLFFQDKNLFCENSRIA